MFHKKSKRPNPYKEANEAFLAVKSREEGHGIRKPSPRSIVFVHYTGRLIDGTVFDSTDEDQLPALFMVGDLIMGWQIVLTRMHEGDKWEVYIPAKWGYGSSKMEDIPAHSTVVFTMKLVKIERL